MICLNLVLTCPTLGKNSAGLRFLAIFTKTLFLIVGDETVETFSTSDHFHFAEKLKVLDANFRESRLGFEFLAALARSTKIFNQGFKIKKPTFTHNTLDPQTSDLEPMYYNKPQQNVFVIFHFHPFTFSCDIHLMVLKQNKFIPQDSCFQGTTKVRIGRND